MHSIKEAIFDEIRKLDDRYHTSHSEIMNSVMFRTPNSLRLTFSGYLVVKKIFTAYSFALPETMMSRHYAGLSVLEYPYFVTSVRLVLFSESDVLMIKLSGGIEKFLESCYQNK